MYSALRYQPKPGHCRSGRPHLTRRPLLPGRSTKTRTLERCVLPTKRLGQEQARTTFTSFTKETTHIVPFLSQPKGVYTCQGHLLPITTPTHLQHPYLTSTSTSTSLLQLHHQRKQHSRSLPTMASPSPLTFCKEGRLPNTFSKQMRSVDHSWSPEEDPLSRLPHIAKPDLTPKMQSWHEYNRITSRWQMVPDAGHRTEISVEELKERTNQPPPDPHLTVVT